MAASGQALLLVAPYRPRRRRRRRSRRQDAANPRGLWRRTTEAEYTSASPAWETVLDIDALGAGEGVSWVWRGYRLLDPGPGAAPTRALVQLSRGGADATVVREFDLAAGRFVPAAAGGFELPEAKSSVAYRDRDTLLVGTDAGPGSLTDSGYPRQVRAARDTPARHHARRAGHARVPCGGAAVRIPEPPRPWPRRLPPRSPPCPVSRRAACAAFVAEDAYPLVP